MKLRGAARGQAGMGAQEATLSYFTRHLGPSRESEERCPLGLVRYGYGASKMGQETEQVCPMRLAGAGMLPWGVAGRQQPEGRERLSPAPASLPRDFTAWFLKMAGSAYLNIPSAKLFPFQ